MYSTRVREERYKHKIILRCVEIDPLVNKLKYMNNKRPSKPSVVPRKKNKK